MQLTTKPVSLWLFIALLAFSLSVYQAVEITFKVRLLQSLRHREHPEAVHYSFEGEDRPAELPIRIPEAAMSIEWPDDELYGLFQDEEWLSLFPRSHGWLELGPKNDLFVVSMYHQLHCLDALRYGYVAARAGMLSYPGNRTAVDHHFNHCLTFLKGIILCKADTTLEVANIYRPIRPGSTKMQHRSDGMGMVHRCQDWTKVRDWLEVNFDERLAKGRVDLSTSETFQDGAD